MGQHSSDTYENDLASLQQQRIDDPLIRIELPNPTPIVGVEMKPIVHFRNVGGCVFEWRRMPKNRRKLLSTTASFRDNNNNNEESQQQHEVNEASSLSTSPRGHEREFSLNDLKPLNLPDPNRTLMHKIAHSGDQSNNDSPSEFTVNNNGLASVNSFRFLPNKERKGVLVCQGVNYTPQQTDVGHLLKFSVTFIGYKHSITSYVETQATIPLPARTPARKWILAEESDVSTKDSTNSSMYSIYDATVSSKFSIMSYNITGKRLIQLLKMKQTAKEVKDRQTALELRDSSFNLPNCPDYVFTDVYRKKLLLREILSYNSDIICIQSMHEQLYNEWYMELSKSGYSGLFKNTFNTAPPPDSKKPADGDLDYCDNSKFGSCILYRRGKFNKNKEWIVKLDSDADITSLLNKLALDHCITSAEKNNIIDQCRTNRTCGIVFELDFKDIYDIMQKIQKKTPSIDYNSIVLLFATVNIYQQELDQKQELTPLERSLICLIQVHILIRKIQYIMKDESYSQKGIKVGIVISGDFDSDMYSLAYEYLSKHNMNRGSPAIDEDERTASASTPPQSDSEEEKEIDNSPLLGNSNELLISTPQQQQSETLDLNNSAVSEIPSTQREQILQHFIHDYKLNSAYRQVTGSEMKYKLSDRAQTLFDATEAIFFSDELKVLRVAEEPQNRTFPNIYFSSDHVALLTELDLNGGPVEQSSSGGKKSQATSRGEVKLTSSSLPEVLE
jgi:mRNA deadenylase 3'-5' endonuclease subunit Ccr4